MLRVRNFVPTISLEGFESATDLRRGNGVFSKATNAMKLLKEKKLFYGIASCYTSANFESITGADAEYVDGCIAGGRRYFHINANGDIDPCVFIHYSDSNIREKSLLEALQSPESAEHLCAKCDRYADSWKPVADTLWQEHLDRH